MDPIPPPGYPSGRPPVSGSAPMATGLHSYPSQYGSWSQPGPPPPAQPQGYYQHPQQNYGYPPPQQQPHLPQHDQSAYSGYPPPTHYDHYYTQGPSAPPPHGMPPHAPPGSYAPPLPPAQQGYAQGPYGGPPSYAPQGCAGAMYGAPQGPGAGPGAGMGYSGPGQPAAYGQSSYGALTHQGSYPGASAPPLGSSLGAPMGAPGAPMGMGNAAHIQLDPYGLPVVIGDQRQERCRMRIEEKVLESTGDSFYIMDERRKPMYTVDGSRTADEYKVLKNAAGGPLLCMRQTSTLKRKMVIFDMGNVPMLTLVRAADDRDRKRVDGFIGNQSGGPPAIVIVGNSSASSFKIENNRENVVADVSRASRSMKRLVTGQDSYVVNVSVGAPALIAMMVVAIDEMFCDPHR